MSTGRAKHQPKHHQMSKTTRTGVAISEEVPGLMEGYKKWRIEPFSKEAGSRWGEETNHNTWRAKRGLDVRFPFQSKRLTMVKVVATVWPSWQSGLLPPHVYSSSQAPLGLWPMEFGFPTPGRSTCTGLPAWCTGRSQTFARLCCRSQ